MKREVDDGTQFVIVGFLLYEFIRNLFAYVLSGYRYSLGIFAALLIGLFQGAIYLVCIALYLHDCKYPIVCGKITYMAKIIMCISWIVPGMLLLLNISSGIGKLGVIAADFLLVAIINWQVYTDSRKYVDSIDK